jgi:hypothetical protein
MVGGAIKRTNDTKYESLCPKNRETYYATSFGLSRAYPDADPVLEEGHGYSCEGGDVVVRFGNKAK